MVMRSKRGENAGVSTQSQCGWNVSPHFCPTPDRPELCPELRSWSVGTSKDKVPKPLPRVRYRAGRSGTRLATALVLAEVAMQRHSIMSWAHFVSSEAVGRGK